MKKILFTIMIFAFAAMTTTSYAQIFKEQDSNPSVSTENSTSSSEVNDSQVGFFRSSTADPPGDRPGNGEGIGQQAPLGDGLHILIAFCMFFGVIKYYSRRRKKIHRD